jgi:hypothetical protein
VPERPRRIACLRASLTTYSRLAASLPIASTRSSFFAIGKGGELGKKGLKPRHRIGNANQTVAQRRHRRVKTDGLRCPMFSLCIVPLGRMCFRPWRMSLDTGLGRCRRRP